MIRLLFAASIAIHDFLEWQEPAAITKAKTRSQAAGGSRGNHERWHVRRGLVVDDCQFCIAPPIG